MIIAIVTCFVATGCTNAENNITSAQVKEVFSKHGILLVEETESNPNAVFSRAYNGVLPERFIFNGQLISLYVYRSSREAEKGIKDFEKKTATAGVVAHNRYHIANIVLYDVIDVEYPDKRVETAVQELKSLSS